MALLTAAPGCSNGDAPGGESGGHGGAATASAGAAGNPSQGGSGGSTAGTGAASSGSSGMTSMGSGGGAGASGGGAGGSATAGSGGTSGMAAAAGGGTAGSVGGVSGGAGFSGGGNGGATSGAGAGGAMAGAGGIGGTPSWCLPVSAHPDGVDWAKALIDSQIRANVSLTWEYPDGLFLHGVYLAYQRLKDATYFSLMKQWADANVNGKSSYDSLDDMQPSLVLDDMYRETKDAKYGTAPKAVANRLTSNYPKTSDGGYWHNTGATNQLWGDGVFMNLPPYVSYGELFNDTQAIDIATQQLIIYDTHLAAPNNLHVHQWDGAAGKQSCCEWCRAEGWYEMALLMVLDVTPSTHKDYAALMEIVGRLAKGLAATQDPASGRWWQVMDKPNDSSNWLETSCTAMHTYFLSKASQKGYVDATTYAPLAIKGFNGEMQMVSNASNVQIKNICPGTGVLASPAEYYARPPATNDNHGLGAFLLMYDQLTCR